MSAPTTRTLDSYELTASPIVEADVPRLHELSVSVNWPHRPEDWRIALDLGQGFAARDEIERIVASVMWFPMGERFVTIGMVITSPRLQDNGAGRWMMEHVLEATAGRDRSLSATKAAYRLYISLGFQPVATVFQHQGIVTARPPAPGGARPMQAGDAEAILALDAAATGANRRRVFAAILPLSSGTVMERGGRITGFALSRRFGRGHVVGPVVAEDEEEALALVAPLVATQAGRFVRMDTRQPDGPLRAYLAAAGLGLYDTVTTMRLGAPPVPAAAATFGLVNHALG